MLQERKIFVYGSLREGFFNYDKYLSGKVESVEIGRVKGKTLYHMPYKGYPAMLSGEGEVVGEVMVVKDYTNTMKAIDEMEGFIGEGHPDNEYNKTLLEIEFADGRKEMCYAYCYNKINDKIFDTEAVFLPSGDWKEYMLNK
ncbi:gamma-glutamylcyclotransferase family protein [Clostridium paraputrificum]|uniref:gamma-glutamylcyclotransferase family protein n=1 Tax=Clostridium paraputrificum TaxID=29363 RepID=UPI003D340FC2